MTEHDEMVRGEDAERLIANPLFKESIQKVRDGIISSMEQSALGDESTHNRLVIALQLLNKIERNIKDVAETGKMLKMQVGKDNIFSRFK